MHANEVQNPSLRQALSKAGPIQRQKIITSLSQAAFGWLRTAVLWTEAKS